jgi:hypothetical protein
MCECYNNQAELNNDYRDTVSLLDARVFDLPPQTVQRYGVEKTIFILLSNWPEVDHWENKDFFVTVAAV